MAQKYKITKEWKQAIAEEITDAELKMTGKSIDEVAEAFLKIANALEKQNKEEA